MEEEDDCSPGGYSLIPGKVADQVRAFLEDVAGTSEVDLSSLVGKGRKELNRLRAELAKADRAEKMRKLAGKK